MLYLTHDEYKDLGFDGLTDDQFDKLLPKATAILDSVTNYFFHRIDILLYNAWTVKQFKMALCAQIEYFHEVGATTFESINKSPQSFSAGRTSVSNASRFNPSGANESKSLVAEDVYIYLMGTGLIYSGVGVIR